MSYKIIRRYHLIIAVLVVLLDRISKYVVARNIVLNDSVTLIPGFFRITHVLNRGAAFGLFSESPSEWKLAVLILFSLAALVVVSALLWKNSHTANTTAV